MFHSTTDRLIEYWRSRAIDGGAPTRDAVSPADFADIAPRVFMLGRTYSGAYPFRLAGEFVADLHGRDLRGLNVLALWDAHDRAMLKSALENARRRPEPIVASADAKNEAGAVGVEVLFAPLQRLTGERDRFLGLYQPLGLTHTLMGAPVRSLALRSLHRAGGAAETPRLRLATLDGRPIS